MFRTGLETDLGSKVNRIELDSNLKKKLYMQYDIFLIIWFSDKIEAI